MGFFKLVSIQYYRIYYNKTMTKFLKQSKISKSPLMSYLIRGTSSRKVVCRQNAKTCSKIQQVISDCIKAIRNARMVNLSP